MKVCFVRRVMTAHLCDVVTSFTADAPGGFFFFLCFLSVAATLFAFVCDPLGGGCFIDSLQH